MFLGIYAFHWLASWTVRNVGPRLVGTVLMVMTVSAALSLSPIPRIGREIPAGGGAGKLLADWLNATFNPLGAVLVLISFFLISLLFTTTFSLVRTVEILKGRIAFLAAWKVQAEAWLEERSREKVRRRLEKRHASVAAVAEQPLKERIRPPRDGTGHGGRHSRPGRGAAAG